MKLNRAFTTQEHYASIIDLYVNPRIGHLPVDLPGPPDIYAMEARLISRRD